MVNKILPPGPFKMSHKWTTLTQRKPWMQLRPRLRGSLWIVETRGSTFSQRARSPTHLFSPPSADRLGVCVVYLGRARVDSLGSRLLFLLAVECVPIAPPNKESVACLPYWSTANGRPAQNFHMYHFRSTLMPSTNHRQPLQSVFVSGPNPCTHTCTHICAYAPQQRVRAPVYTKFQQSVRSRGKNDEVKHSIWDAQAAHLGPGARLSLKTAEVVANTRLHVFTGGCPSPRLFF